MAAPARVDDYTVVRARHVGPAKALDVHPVGVVPHGSRGAEFVGRVEVDDDALPVALVAEKEFVRQRLDQSQDLVP